MLDSLFGSKTRAQLLNLFFLNPEEHFYIRGLARKFKTHTNSVRRELNNLVDIGVFRELTEKELAQIKKKGKFSQARKYYGVNTNFVLYPELKSLFAKAKLLVRDRLSTKLKKIGKLELLILTGGFTDAPQVQTDILLVGKIDKTKLAKEIQKFEKEIGKDIYYTVMDRKEYDNRVGITDCFLFDVLTSRKLVLIDKIGISKDG